MGVEKLERFMIGALGINIKLLYTLVFGLGAALAGLAGMMQAPILTVQIGMGENILILAFVVIIVGFGLLAWRGDPGIWQLSDRQS